MDGKRNYGIDLLRLVLMFMVSVLHVLGQGGVIKACVDKTPGYYTFYLLRSISLCAVDGFAIISGYVATNKPRKFDRIINMWFQAFFYSFILLLILTLVGFNPNWNYKSLIKAAFPVTFIIYWYFTAYFALFFAIPVLNPFLFSVDKSTAKKAFLLIVILFSVIGCLNDSFKTQFGYSALWLIVLYCVGVLAKRIELFESLKSIVLIVLFAACVIVTWVSRVFFGQSVLMSYISPTVFLCGMILVILFSRLRPKGRLIAKLSPLAFGVYLFQLNPVVWKRGIKGAFAFLAQKGLVVGVAGVLVSAFILFAAGLLLEFLRSKLEKLFRIQAFSRKIAALIDLLLNKVSVLLR